MKKLNALLVILILAIGVAIGYMFCKSITTTEQEQKLPPIVTVSVSIPDPLVPVIEIEEAERTVYALDGAVSFDKLPSYVVLYEGPSDGYIREEHPMVADKPKQVRQYARTEVVEVMGTEVNSGWLMLTDGTVMDSQFVTEDSLFDIDETLYILDKCTGRKTPDPEGAKGKKYTEPGQAVHATSVDVATNWYCIGENEYLEGEHLLKDRVVRKEQPDSLYAITQITVKAGPSADAKSAGKELYSGDTVKVYGTDIFTGWYLIDKSREMYVDPAKLSDRIPTLANSQDDLKKKTYKWTSPVSGGEYSWNLKISNELYNFYRGKKRIYSYTKYHEYFDEEANAYYIKAAADAFKSLGKKKKWSSDRVAMEAVAFVQNLTYKTDKKSRKVEEFPKYAIETLYDKSGDCEDVAILAAGILHEMGYKVALVHLPGHMACAISGLSKPSGTYYELNGVKYYYIECTNQGWKIGDLPEEYKKTSAELYVVE